MYFISMKAKWLRGFVASLLISANLILTAGINTAQNVHAAGDLENEQTTIVPGQIIVQFLPDFNLQGLNSPQNVPSSLASFFNTLGVTSLKGLGGNSNIFLLNISLPVNDAIKIAASERLVKRAEANRVEKITQAGPGPRPNDPLYTSGKQWWLDKIQAPQAWSLTTGSPSVIEAVIDTGIDASHPDLIGHIVDSYDFVNERREVTDDNGHGTAVASCIGANSNDGQGLAGINWNARFLNIKAGSNQGRLFSFDVARAIIFAVDNGAKVINGSFGGSFPIFSELAAISYAQSKNVVLVFSSGNDGSSSPQYPAGFSNVISVGATDYLDRVTDFSSFGPQTSIVAPGAGIWMAKAGGGYISENGTSFSSPIVAGVVSLMFSVNPNLTPSEVKNILEGTADDISGGEGFNPKAGWGRVNAYRAVYAAKNNDLYPNKQSFIKGKVSGVDPAKVSLSLDPFGISFKPDSSGNFSLPFLGKANYRLRAALKGVGTGQGVKEVKLSGKPEDIKIINFAFQNQTLNPSLIPEYIDLARNFDPLPEKPASSGSSSSLWFRETGHTLAGQFQRYWEEHGGLPVFGFPLSEPFFEISETDGKLYTVQYFERNRFEYHPENKGNQYEVLLGLLGSEQARGRSFLQTEFKEGSLYFSETGHSLDFRFIKFWMDNGGLAIFGYPISEVVEENGLKVQYLERNRFEFHPENVGNGYEVLLGLLGRDLSIQRNYLPG